MAGQRERTYYSCAILFQPEIITGRNDDSKPLRDGSVLMNSKSAFLVKEIRDHTYDSDMAYDRVEYSNNGRMK